MQLFLCRPPVFPKGKSEDTQLTDLHKHKKTEDIELGGQRRQIDRMHQRFCFLLIGCIFLSRIIEIVSNSSLMPTASSFNSSTGFVTLSLATIALF